MIEIGKFENFNIKGRGRVLALQKPHYKGVRFKVGDLVRCEGKTLKVTGVEDGHHTIGLLVRETEEKVDLLKEMQAAIRKMYEYKEELVKKALTHGRCPECGLPPKTARWGSWIVAGQGLTEWLECMCDKGHTWMAGDKDGEMTVVAMVSMEK